VTLFIIACVVMAGTALVLVVWPLLKASSTESPSTNTQRRGHFGIIAALTIAIPLLAALVYASIGRLHWERDLAASAQQNTTGPEVESMVAQLEERLRQSPDDVDGWLLLGRSYMALERPQQSLDAYRKALRQSGDKNVEAMIGVAESMMIIDERTIAGEAGQLFESALALEPANPKALWYSAIASLARQNLPQAHERLQRLLTLNPPGEIRSIIERQLQDIEEQLNGNPSTASAPTTEGATAQSQRAVTVTVSIAPSLANGIDQKTPLFVVARDPTAPGPPLAAIRRAVGDLPFTVTISDNDAMMQGRGIGSVQSVQIVARVSKTGTPQAQPGDLYGEANVAFAANQRATVKIVIDRAVANK